MTNTVDNAVFTKILTLISVFSVYQNTVLKKYLFYTDIDNSILNYDYNGVVL